MKLKKIESILKRRKTILCECRPDCQWIGDGAAFYAVCGLPRMGKMEFLTMFDVPEDKRGGWHFDEVEISRGVDLSDFVKNETELPRGILNVVYRGTEYEPLLTSDGVLLIDRDYLRPFAGEENIGLFERVDAAGKRYVAVKEGVLLVGIVYPVQPGNDFVDRLLELAAHMRLERENAPQEQADKPLIDATGDEDRL